MNYKNSRRPLEEDFTSQNVNTRPRGGPSGIIVGQAQRADSDQSGTCRGLAEEHRLKGDAVGLEDRTDAPGGQALCGAVDVENVWTGGKLALIVHNALGLDALIASHSHHMGDSTELRDLITTHGGTPKAGWLPVSPEPIVQTNLLEDAELLLKPM